MSRSDRLGDSSVTARDFTSRATATTQAAGHIRLTAIYDVRDTAELAWQNQALCAQTDPEAFYPEKGGATRDAKRVCRSCEVRSQCLAYALDHDERFGIWGGMSERERRRLKRSAVPSRPRKALAA